jgi:hypothetical protein
MKHTINFELAECVDCEVEIELCNESSERGNVVWWTESFNRVTLSYNDLESVYEWRDMNHDLIDIIIESIGEVVGDISLGDAREIENDYYESTLDI